MSTEFSENAVVRDNGGRFAEQAKSEPQLVALASSETHAFYREGVPGDDGRHYAFSAVEKALAAGTFTEAEIKTFDDEASEMGRMEDALRQLKYAINRNPGAWQPENFGDEITRLMIARRNERAHQFGPDQPVLWNPNDEEDIQAYVTDYDMETGTVSFETATGIFGEAHDTELEPLAKPSWHLPSAGETFEQAAPFIDKSPDEYKAALERIFPFAQEEHTATMLHIHKYQTAGWQRTQLSNYAIANEMAASFNVERREVSFGENPHFTTQPVTDLEQYIDSIILGGNDPSSDENVAFLGATAGEGCGAANIKALALRRMEARRPTV